MPTPPEDSPPAIPQGAAEGEGSAAPESAAGTLPPAEPGHAVPQPGDPVPEPGDTVPEPGDTAPKPGDAVMEPDDAVVVPGDPAAGRDTTGPQADLGLPPPPEAVRIAEALVFASATPVTAARLAPLLPAGVGAAATLAALAEAYAGRGVTLVNVAGGWAFRTAEDLAPLLTRVVEAPRRLPRVAMEALAIIAWHQPATRGEIEEIRGTALSQTTLEVLLENGLIAPRGKKEAPGRPTLWGTTPRFLEQFGLASLRDLPRREELMPDAGLVLPLPAPTPAVPTPPEPEAEGQDGGEGGSEGG